MKLYFAKYVSVEGEIKEGDHFLNKEENMVHQMTTPYNETQYKSLNSKEHFKKVKLFLCSRDIQVGDKVHADYWIDKGGKYESHFVKEGECLGYDEKIDHYRLKNPDTLFLGKFCIEYALKEGSFKLIGEISPEATWVKEGDEFDEYEEWWWNPEIRVPVMKRLKEYWDKMIEEGKGTDIKLEVVCKVKGPCGHFH